MRNRDPIDVIAAIAIIVLMIGGLLVMAQMVLTPPPQIEMRFDSERGIVCYTYSDAIDCMTDPLEDR